MNSLAIADRAPARCPHCGAAVDGDQPRFCCPGCELAASILQNAGLDDDARRWEAQPARPEPSGIDWAMVQVQPAGEAAEARLAVDGLRCTSCTWLVEQVLQRTEGVEAATVSYATGRALIRFDPRRVDLGQLARRVESVGYRPRPLEVAAALDRDLLTRLGFAAFAAMNVMLLAVSLYAGWWDGMEERFVALFQWVSLALSTPVALWSAGPFHQGAKAAVRERRVTMDLPISLAVGLLWVHGLVSTLVGEEAYFDSLTMLVALLLAGRVVEARGRQRALGAATALAAKLPRRARRIEASGVVEVGADQLAVGDQVWVGAGEESPGDGRVLEGSAQVRMALLTGESEPVELGRGDQLVAGAEVVGGALRVEVTAVGEDALPRRMARQVLAALDRGLPETPTDRLAPFFTVFSLVAALAGLVAWYAATGDVTVAVRVAASVLVVACPCALGLAWPVAVGAGLASAARRGVLLRSGDALLRLAEVRLVAFDKTGTLTEGVPVVVEASDEVLRVAAALEAASHHPIARALLGEARRRDLPLPVATSLHELPGVGVAGVVEGQRLRLVAGQAGEVALWGEAGRLGRILLRDVPREDAARAVAAVGAAGAEPWLISGDSEEVAARIGASVGIARIYGRISPEGKAQLLQQAAAEGRPALFVGDGLNDGPALAAAHAGLAMRDAATSSLVVADGVVTGGLRGVAGTLAVAHVVRRVVRGTLRLSATYNVLAVGAALAGLVNPLVAAVLMPLSSLVVVTSALLVEGMVKDVEARWTS